MTEPTPENLAELRLDAERCASDPDFPHDGLGRLVRALPALMDAAAERDALAERLGSVEAGRDIERRALANALPLVAERDALAAKVAAVRALAGEWRAAGFADAYGFSFDLFRVLDATEADRG